MCKDFQARSVSMDSVNEVFPDWMIVGRAIQKTIDRDIQIPKESHDNDELQEGESGTESKL